jgi:CDP-diglyceride synthetase
MKQIKEIYMYALGALVIFGFFFILFVIFNKVLPSENKEIGLLVVGALIAKFGDVVGYFFGSSKSSADKNDIINNQMK